MLLKIRDISAKFTLLVYLMGFLSAGLFHYHDTFPAEWDCMEGISINHQDAGDSESQTASTHCSLCLITNLQYDLSHSSIPSRLLEQEYNYYYFSGHILKSHLEYASQRAPPLTV